MSRGGLVMSQSIENNIISTVFHKVKGACGLLSDSKAQRAGRKNGQRVDH